jgi:hypothetical protein
MSTSSLSPFLAAALIAGAPFPSGAAQADAPFASPLAAEDLDPAAFAQWVDGAEKPLEVRDGPRHVIWTRNSRPEWSGVRFGDSKQLGARHLRLGWKNPVPVGTVLARGGGQVSVLKANAACLGDLKDDAQWVPAQRLKNARVGRDGAAVEDIALWVLPPKTSTRAIRFTHTPEPTDKLFSGWLGGVCLLADRFATVGSQAVAVTANSPERAGRINDDSNNGTWGAWENGPAGVETPVSPEPPRWSR